MVRRARAWWLYEKVALTSGLGLDSDVLNGYNGTIFAYGQTGSGKTFTMMVRLPATLGPRRVSPD